MASTSPSIDPKSGFCAETKTFHSLRPEVPLPSETLPLSFTSYALSLLPSPLPSHPALIDASSTSLSVSYPSFISHLTTLASNLRSSLNLSKGQVAFILSPPNLHIPALYFALLSLGVVVSPSNPASSPSEISHQLSLISPVSVAFASSSAAHLLPPHIPTVILDSPRFLSLLLHKPSAALHADVEVLQSDTAAIQFSSGTTGRVKAAALTHRNFIAMTAGFHAEMMADGGRRERCLLIGPMFHSFGFFYAMKGLALGETTVFGRMAGFAEMISAAERHRVTMIAAAPPVVVAMARGEEVLRYDLGALERVSCGGAPLSVEAGLRFMERFPRVELRQGYGSTEGGGISRMIGHEECKHVKATGRLSENVEAKIVDIITGNLLSVGQSGELWLRGPAIMKGYVGDEEANATSFDSGGWLKTGDLCYFDNDGYLFVVDRLKELIKYKAYQVPPVELEHILHALPDVVDAAVVPYPQEEVGEIPMAFVVRKPGSNLNKGEIMDLVAQQVAPYKKIRKVAFVNSIPKSAAGKILRRKLANQALKLANQELYGNMSRL